ncbi:hypothetical protein JIQ42_04260 [Leishmania sp. Namibia]|uniref:hypothetical protein n=1 Tax=Leishmania sp. Namibia TaxID=2802991 RepID=UPI001B4C8130|nr:hypothetical protein JIQ42_04260 [Leishmania sp. Namibia]
MLHSKRSLCWVKPMLLWRILLNLLGVFGSSIIAAPLADGTSVDLGISSWTAVSASGLVFSTVVLLFADGVWCDGRWPQRGRSAASPEHASRAGGGAAGAQNAFPPSQPGALLLGCVRPLRVKISATQQQRLRLLRQPQRSVEPRLRAAVPRPAAQHAGGRPRQSLLAAVCRYRGAGLCDSVGDTVLGARGGAASSQNNDVRTALGHIGVPPPMCLRSRRRGGVGALVTSRQARHCRRYRPHLHRASVWLTEAQVRVARMPGRFATSHRKMDRWAVARHEKPLRK